MLIICYICIIDRSISSFMKIPSRRDYKSGHAVELLRSGRQYFSACVKEIDKAKHYIHFQTYIVDDDETGRRFVNALIKAARRGVRVYFLLDAFGGSSFSKNLTDAVEEAGILFRKFSSKFITKDFQMSLRLHHKVLLDRRGNSYCRRHECGKSLPGHS